MRCPVTLVMINASEGRWSQRTPVQGQVRRTMAHRRKCVEDAAAASMAALNAASVAGRVIKETQ